MSHPHDLGGVDGMGPVHSESEHEEPVFHAQWERRVFSLTLGTGMLGKWTIDESRHARERQSLQDYLRNSYYQNWLVGLNTLLEEKQLLSQSELRSGRAEADNNPVLKLRVPAARDVPLILGKSSSYTMSTSSRPRFNVKDTVRVKVNTTSGHTRAPRYTQAALGTIALYHGCHVLPDQSARGIKKGEHLYSVRFSAKELWDSWDDDEVFVDLWESYLEAVK
jgi:nitrile hydratase subunit beta